MIDTKAFATVRKNGLGDEFITMAETSPLRALLAFKIQEAKKSITRWDADNPIVRIIEVEIKELRTVKNFVKS
jgi:hypothetical protein